jgi:hypothetical protein
LEDVDMYDLFSALTMLHPLLQKHMVENDALLLLLLWKKYSCSGLLDHDIERFFEAMKVHELLGPFLNDQTKYLEIFINVEYQRICEAEKWRTVKRRIHDYLPHQFLSLDLFRLDIILMNIKQ